MIRVYAEEIETRNVATRIAGQEFLLTVLTIPWRYFPPDELYLIEPSHKIGKTEFALSIAEKLLKAGVVDEIFTNIPSQKLSYKKETEQ